MVTIEHPTSLNVLTKFHQVSSLYKSTSRSKNPGWYLPSLSQDFQVHVRTEGAEINAFTYNRKTNLWSTLPSPSTEILRDPLHTQSWALEILRLAEKAGAKAIGLVLHVADELATAELKPEFEEPDLLPQLREAATHDPASILSDSSISPEHHSWRVIPYAPIREQAIGTTLSISRAHEPFLTAIRSAGQTANIPITTHALSAPLVALTAIPHLIKPTENRPFVTILQYPWFTALAFFNAQGELLLIRTQQHRGLRRPSNFRRTISTTNASLELQDPDLFVFPLGPRVDQALVNDLRVVFTESRIEWIAPAATEGLHSWCPEPQIAACPPATTDIPLSRTFTILRDEAWAFQDFLPPAQAEVELFPSRSEMQLLKFCRIARVALLAITVTAIGWSAFQVLSTIQKPEWSFDPEVATTTKTRLAKLSGEKIELSHLDNLLEDRSKAWSSMELLSRIIPPSLGIRVNTFTHTTKPDTAPGQAKIGYVKEWKLTGVTRGEGMEHLQTINSRDGITALFKELAAATGDPAFDPSIGNRTLVPNVRTQENNNFRQRPAEEIDDLDDTTYPLLFDLTITQRFESSDPLAIHSSKAVAEASVPK